MRIFVLISILFFTTCGCPHPKPQPLPAKPIPPLTERM